MKVAIVYTSTTPQLIEMVERELRSQVGEATFLSYQDPSILKEACDNGFVTARAAGRLVEMFGRAVDEGADVILNCCSSVGEVVDSVQPFARYCGIPIVRIDEEMCRIAVRKGSRIAVMATLPSTLNPTKNTVLRAAREMNRRVTLVDVLVDGAFGLAPDQFRSRMLEKALAVKEQCDLLLFAQGSMAYAADYIAEQLGKPVLSSPSLGAKAVKRALEEKGMDCHV